MHFGSQRNQSGTDTSAYKFTDQELDGGVSESNLYNYNARLYDPIIGRFISPDTIVQAPYNPQALNRYTYCLNNPLIYTDPSGHQQMPFEAYAQLIEMMNTLCALFPSSAGLLSGAGTCFLTGFEVQAVNTEAMELAQFLDETRSSGGGGSGSGIVKNIVPKIEKGDMAEVKAIVLHSTDGSTASGAIIAFEKTGYGTHYVIDKDGTIYQTANLEKYTYHVGKIRSKAGYTTEPWSAKEINDYEIANNNYPQRYPTSLESIGIEIVRKHTSKGWEAATGAQLNSLKYLVTSLQTSYNLTSNDIYHHDKISYKTPGEGGGLGF